jgi:hypothetical protein
MPWTPMTGDGTTPYAGLPARIMVTVDPGPGADTVNNFAQENIVNYDMNIAPRLGVPVPRQEPSSAPMPSTLRLSASPSTAVHFTKGGGAGVGLEPGAKGGLLPFSVTLKKHPRPGQVITVRIHARQLAYELLNHVPFGASQTAYHGEMRDAGSMALFIRGVAPSKLRISTARARNKAIVRGILSPHERAVIAVDLLRGSHKRVWTRLARTDKAGSFRLSFKPPDGRFTVHAFWQGDLRHGMTTSWRAARSPRFHLPSVVAPRAQVIPAAPNEHVAMSCPGKATVNGSTSISGTLKPAAPGERVYVRARSGKVDTWLPAVVAANGTWQTKYSFPSGGQWQLTGYYFGDVHHAGAVPDNCSVLAE